jgi:hypothetical protein
VSQDSRLQRRLAKILNYGRNPFQLRGTRNCFRYLKNLSQGPATKVTTGRSRFRPNVWRFERSEHYIRVYVSPRIIKRGDPRGYASRREAEHKNRRGQTVPTAGRQRAESHTLAALEAESDEEQ